MQLKHVFSLVFLLLLFSPIDPCDANEFRDSTTPYEKLKFNINNEIVTLSIRDSFETFNDGNSSTALDRHEAIVNITCERTCSRYQERIYGCAFGAFQFLPDSEDIITVWMPECIQPFKVIIYNMSKMGVRKILDENSGAPPQFLLGKSKHPDVLLLAGLLNGEGVFHKWAWNGDAYAISSK